MAEDSVAMNTFYRDFFIFWSNSTLEKGASSTNTHICCRRACSSTLPFFAQQLEETGLVCKAAAPEKEACSRTSLLIVNFMLLEFLQLFNVCYSITELIFLFFLFVLPQHLSTPFSFRRSWFYIQRKLVIIITQRDLQRQPGGSNSQVPLNFWGNLAPNSSRFFFKMSFLN